MICILLFRRTFAFQQEKKHLCRIDAHGMDEHSYMVEGLKPPRHRKMTKKLCPKMKLTTRKKNTANTTHRRGLASVAPRCTRALVLGQCKLVAMLSERNLNSEEQPPWNPAHAPGGRMALKGFTPSSGIDHCVFCTGVSSRSWHDYEFLREAIG